VPVGDWVSSSRWRACSTWRRRRAGSAPSAVWSPWETETEPQVRLWQNETDKLRRLKRKRRLLFCFCFSRVDVWNADEIISSHSSTKITTRCFLVSPAGFALGKAADRITALRKVSIILLLFYYYCYYFVVIIVGIIIIIISVLSSTMQCIPNVCTCVMCLIYSYVNRFDVFYQNFMKHVVCVCLSVCVCVCVCVCLIFRPRTERCTTSSTSNATTTRPVSVSLSVVLVLCRPQCSPSRMIKLEQ